MFVIYLKQLWKTHFELIFNFKNSNAFNLFHNWPFIILFKKNYIFCIAIIENKRSNTQIDIHELIHSLIH